MNFTNTPRRSELRARSHVVATSPRGETRRFQIGPRIRVGGTLGKIGQNIKIGAGKVASNPIVQGIAGATLGPGAAAAIGGLGKVLDTSHGSVGVGDIAGGAIKGGAAGYAGSKLGSAVKSGIGSLPGALGSSGSDGEMPMGMGNPDGSAAPAGGDSSWWEKAKGVFSGPGNDGQGNFGVLGDLSGKGGDLLGKGQEMLGGGGGTGLDKALLLAMIVDAAAKAKRQRELEDKGLAYATDAYDAKHPLRMQGLSMMQSQQTPDLSFLNNAANPYTKTVTPFNVSAKTPVLPKGGTY